MRFGLHILLLQVNESFTRELFDSLNRCGWMVQYVRSSNELDSYLKEKIPDIVLVNANGSSEDCYSVTKRLRLLHPNLGIVVLSDQMDQISREMGYTAGADVYLSKPTRTNELFALLTNLGKRVVGYVKPPCFILDRIAGQLFSPNGRSCTLSGAELNLLEVLAISAGKEVDFEQIYFMMRTFDAKEMSKASLTSSICRLRRKFKTELGADNLIVASRGVGYRLTVDMRLK